MVVIKLDGKEFEAGEDDTILDVARRNDVYIPTLCNHKDLSPFGACRLCLVKVEGMNKYVPACATPINDDMSVVTTEDQLNELRRGILELILAEHPSACLVCEEREECMRYHKEPTKAGRVTGCRFCPNRDDCQLFEVTRFLELKDIWVQNEYKDAPLIRTDPFIQRDYNLCILCGRCVRVCNEIRGVSAIAFTKRSNEANIGTAFGKPLQDASCIFCGSCEDVCPTGAISSKMTRWMGTPENIVDSTCVMCPANCTMEMEYKWGRFSYVTPSGADDTTAQCCLRGRYCSVPLVNSKGRLEYPRVMIDGNQRPLNWDDAYKAASEGLKRYTPDEIGMVISPSLTTEEAFLAQRIARGLGSDNIAIASNMAGPVQKAWGSMMDRVAGIGRMSDLADCDMILVIGTDLSLSAPVSLVHIHKAHLNGARVVDMIHAPRWTYRQADIIVPEVYSDMLDMILQEVRTPGQEPHTPERDLAGDVACSLREASKVGVLLGPSAFLDPEEGEKTALLTAQIFDAVNGKVLLPLWDGGNVQGALEAGASRCIYPGQCLADEDGLPSGSDPLGEGIKALYLTQPVPAIPDSVEFIIYQGPFPSDIMDRADVILPTTTYPETEGTVISMDGRVGIVGSDSKPPNMAKPDWIAFIELGNQLGLDGFEFSTPEDVRKEVGIVLTPRSFLPDAELIREGRRMEMDHSQVNPQGPWPCSATHYRGHPIAEDIEDFEEVIRKWRWDE